MLCNKISHYNVTAQQLESGSCSPQLETSLYKNKDLARPKIHKIDKIKKKNSGIQYKVLTCIKTNINWPPLKEANYSKSPGSKRGLGTPVLYQASLMLPSPNFIFKKCKRWLLAEKYFPSSHNRCGSPEMLDSYCSL